jgi:hypothetical protein
MNLGVIALNWSLMSKCCFRLAVQFQVCLQNLIKFYSLSLLDQFFIRLDELTAFNLAKNEFEQIKTKPDPNFGYPRERSCHSLVHRGNMVYLLGGRDMEMTVFDTIWRFDLETLQWTQLNTGLPIPVFFNAAAITPVRELINYGQIL